ncbi:phage tail domain-containing protein [Enterococcus sp. 5H]|uniref:phage tail domain-containing protein n=1 Tax=Enterococcus sp. 5H TaxID=1229490 RepID=UPI002302317B|nr:phage tail domain-containing protein [Enterococcus sp. 5H]MDA9472639.1 Phage protein [Enterococcus sp. 5H]
MQITIDDTTTLADFNMVVLAGWERPLSPAIKAKTVEIPGLIGEWDFGDELNSRTLKIPVAYMGQETANRSFDLRKFMDFITDDFGRPRLLKIIFSDENDVFQLVKMKVAPNPKYYVVGADFELTLVGNDPNKYARFTAEDVCWGSEEIDFTFDYTFGHSGRGEIHIQSDNVVWGSEVIDFTYNFLMGDTSGSNANTPISKKFELENKGLAVSPIVRIRGSATRVTFYANGEKAFVIKDLVNADYELDWIRYVGFLNGKEVFIDGEFVLKPGINEIVAEAINADIYFSVSYRERFN